jgi:hypothetical protein
MRALLTLCAVVVSLVGCTPHGPAPEADASRPSTPPSQPSQPSQPSSGLSLASVSSSEITLAGAASGAGLEVTLTGPARVAALGRGTWNRMGGCGFQIDWGDGSSVALGAGVECRTFLRHVYTKAGSYKVAVSTYRILPTDARETDWKGEATVVVE